MLNNPTKLLLSFILIFSTMICISSNSWLGAWIGLEINLLSFIPLMNNNKNSISNEASLKYFLIQALASIILLFFVCMNYMNMNYFSIMIINKLFLLMINSSLLLKIGAAPFHFWFPSIMDSMNWINNFILMTWQKINPMICISYCFNYKFIMVISLISIIIGSLGGFNYSSIRKIMSFSSISHIGWLLIALMSSEFNFWFYFLFYSFISLALIMFLNKYKLFFINQLFNNMIPSLSKFSIIIAFLSMGGLPPFIGFFPKWIIVESLINLNIYLLPLSMIMFTLLTLYFYLRLSFSLMILNNNQMSWKLNKIFNKKMFLFNFITSVFFPMIFILFMT